MGGGDFDFRRATVFCLGHRLPKHKITRYAKNLRGHGPLALPGYVYELKQEKQTDR